ncbi:hypothetical protein FHR81_003927 [Actinoalloteichus hoggarensis]|uniref:Uncharacterized protein n=1 Tax=Actinoalloteichus hoggarensis TaxID=1470176 RepID=A0A221VW55_9PSEU|nr:hypothetical protein [Actinoalloteichus hoggarensis]ASO17743.1 hypothetical protein AHOG_00345 [Actinoalloteichus hoggarensis]MBB5922870.1 hypothetical protein [Actinoalloteichus hoggarensis]
MSTRAGWRVAILAVGCLTAASCAELDRAEQDSAQRSSPELISSLTPDSATESISVSAEVPVTRRPAVEVRPTGPDLVCEAVRTPDDIGFAVTALADEDGRSVDCAEARRIAGEYHRSGAHGVGQRARIDGWTCAADSTAAATQGVLCGRDDDVNLTVVTTRLLHHARPESGDVQCGGLPVHDGELRQLVTKAGLPSKINGTAPADQVGCVAAREVIARVDDGGQAAHWTCAELDPADHPSRVTTSCESEIGEFFVVLEGGA